MKKKSIAVVCPYPEGVSPNQRLKYEQYFESWREAGWEVTVYAFQTLRFYQINPHKSRTLEKVFWTIYGYLKRLLLIFKLRKFDIVYTFLYVTPFGPPIFEMIYRKLAKKMIYDIDDLVFLGNTSEANSWISKLKGRKKPIYLMKHSDHIITCTPYLDDFVRQYNMNTTDISSTINTDLYQISNEPKQGKITLGWSGSHSTAKYLDLLKPVFLELRKTHEFKLIVMGALSYEIPEIEIELVPWCVENEVKTIQRFDIGLYPLPDELWVHGKSGLKALQYMACGVPTVAAKVGEAIKRVVLHRENGLLVSSEAEWLQGLKELMDNEDLRKKLGHNGRAHVEKYYSIHANKPIYLDILNSNLPS
jgi:glycosyltransferase involved in cell wall biosynthesis